MQKKFVNHYGVHVRDRVPISVREWKKKKDNPLISFVSERENFILWDSVTTDFTLPAGVDLRNLVKSLGSQEDRHTIPDLEEAIH